MMCATSRESASCRTPSVSSIIFTKRDGFDRPRLAGKAQMKLSSQVGLSAWCSPSAFGGINAYCQREAEHVRSTIYENGLGKSTATRRYSLHA